MLHDYVIFILKWKHENNRNKCILIDYAADIQSTVWNMESAVFPFYLHTLKKIVKLIEMEKNCGPNPKRKY